MGNTSPAKHVIAAFAALLAMVFVAWQVGYKAGFEKASPLPPPSSESPLGTKSVAGTVTAVGEKSFTLVTLATGPKTPSATKTVSVTAETTFERRLSKDPEAFLGEMDAFAKRVQQATSTAARPELPVPYTLQRASFSDIGEKDFVLVTATEDIGKASAFTAAKVVIEPGPPATASPPPSKR